MVIAATERVAQVLARDERLLEVFVSTAPAFTRLRNPMLRRTMARLVTVEQAARVAGIDPDHLVERLNRALRELESSPVPDEPPTCASATPTAREQRPMTSVNDTMPAALRGLPAERLVDLDVREDLRSGREPFSRIMAARRDLPPGSVLRLRAIFEPVPLYAVLQKQGFEHWTERLADDDWRVWFYDRKEETGKRKEDEKQGSSSDPRAGGGGDEDAGVVVLDVRGLEPPEPMLRTLAALEQLPPGGTLVQLNVRVPQFLLPRLAEQGFEWEVREQAEDLVRIFIRRRSEQ
jgi:uncharacterized protein (DUF2249 family)